MAPKKSDRDGYKVIKQGGGEDFMGRPVDVTWAVVRDDGVGLGAFNTQEEVDAIIAHDRAQTK